MLGKLGITASFSRPRVSDDNAFVESLFRTCKYVPNFLRSGFAGWYNYQHKHRGINYVTADQRQGGDIYIDNRRKA